MLIISCYVYLLIAVLACVDNSIIIKAEAFVQGSFTSSRRPYFRQSTASSFSSSSAASRKDDEASSSNESSTHPSLVYDHGPLLSPDSEILAGISLAELGLDVAIAPSTSSSGLGLFVRLDDENVESITIPSMTLLCGYSRSGSFEQTDIGDKTVGFVIRSPQTAVFYERKLMSIVDALEMAARNGASNSDSNNNNNNSCGLVGHSLEQVQGDNDNGHIQITPVQDGFPRYFVPQGANQENGAVNDDFSVSNFGQYCNDLAWDYSNPPTSAEEYADRSATQNVLQLTWRLEYDAAINCLKPSWPVSVLKGDVTFTSQDDFVEIGTQYGWTYWQATVDLEKL